jgi:hypothetical protein
VADAIELEHLLGQLLSKCFEKHRGLFEKCVLTHEGLFDFYKKHLVLNKLIHAKMASFKESGNDDSFSKIKAKKKILDAFPDDIIHIRNALAHQSAELSETGLRKVKVKGKRGELTTIPSEFVAIRKNIKKHRENLLQLEPLL